MTLKEKWGKKLKIRGLKFFVIKIDDLFEALDDRNIECFDKLLGAIEYYRIKKGKDPNNNYYIVNRDEPYANEVKNIIEENEGIVIKNLLK